MKVLPSSWDDLVIPKLVLAGWNWTKSRDWRLPAAFAILVYALLVNVLALKTGLMWLELFGPAQDPVFYSANNVTIGAMILNSSACMAVVTGFILMVVTHKRDIAWRHLDTRVVLAVHLTMIGWVVTTCYRFLSLEPFYLENVIETVFGILGIAVLILVIQKALLNNQANPAHWTRNHLPLAHLVLLSFIQFCIYWKTFGEVIDVIK